MADTDTRIKDTRAGTNKVAVMMMFKDDGSLLADDCTPKFRLFQAGTGPQFPLATRILSTRRVQLVNVYV